MLLSAGVSFPCLTLKYRRFTVESHSVGETPASCPYPTAPFGEQRFNLFHNSSCTQSTPRVLEIGAFAHLIQISRFYRRKSWCRGNSCFLPLSNRAIWRIAFSTCFTISHVRKVHHESWKSGLSRISSKYRRFTFFNHSVGGNQIFRLYPTAPFGVLASHPKTAVWALKIKGRGAPAL